ncbi:MAG TPA: serpin family protein [Bacteroidales bacterium]|nr:serpin family protein [Bacteroidales bacterium]HPT20822.1 serpin family protein [Bacteroidales bacterium]
MKKIILNSTVALSLSIPLFLLSCNKEQEEVVPVDPVPISLTTNQVSLITSENSFAFDIFRKVLENTDESKNVIISPLSISYALSMTLNGANGSTRDSMLKALRVSGITPDEINDSYKNLTEALLSVDKRIHITIANSVWTKDDFEVKKSFIDILTNYYDADSKRFNPEDPAAPGLINGWIEDNTNGLIKNMIDKIEDNTVMLLINAIYFKGKWNSQFEKSKTVEESFHTSSGTSVEVPMMKQSSDFKVYDGDGFVLAEIPYGQGNFVMDIILPDEVNSINSLIPAVTDAAFTGWIGEMRNIKVDLSFPRFKYGYKEEMKKTLSAMGMEIAFTDQADFSNINASYPLTITKVLHQAFIETNEEGTEAAAATVVVIGTTSANPTNFVLTLDHPFLYIIRETSTNSVLFMGRVTNPLSE